MMNDFGQMEPFAGFTADMERQMYEDMQEEWYKEIQNKKNMKCIWKTKTKKSLNKKNASHKKQLSEILWRRDWMLSFDSESAFQWN